MTEVTDSPKTTQVAQIIIKESWCKGCAICVEFCPKKVFVMNGRLPAVVNIEACNRCMLCEIRCPDFALKVI
ncbi:MAG: 2-ketoglutarate ferredoxin oxidoreductase subunit delta [candidate division KSB1 bacterium]|nr:2-ketoglutarate ferredoxin oxidoreductase subunit delta [candidate division KSB1 bacterium]MDZ7300762.1 2-ketoglutarate ferredoxin oxidoreductase subunit delta [candidate division KSB1 bacterium]MDZ7309968.1 2-ketoglutarate ferredoxin oxidoreductase subunit delta [candidate division KSB1 bacterium]